MRLPFASLALALAVSAAPVVETTTDLPARFGLVAITAEPRVNGLRLQVGQNGSPRPPVPRRYLTHD